MTKKTIRNIVFDLGDVILNIDIPRTVLAFSTLSGRSPEEISELFKQAALFRKFETGSLDEAGFRNLVRSSLDLPTLTDLEIDTAWNELLLDIPLERIDLLKKLAGKYNLYLLSNTSSIHITRVNEILKEASGIETLQDLFTTVFLSYEMGVMKPDPSIYLRVLEKAGIQAEETLFLDDNLANIEAANGLGIQTIHVQKPVTILEYLALYV
jgi:epoxide hydrolase-like predicted phosphatase